MGRKIMKIAGAVTAGAVVAVAAVALIYSKGVCKDTWYGGTSINGIDVSGHTLDETAALFPDGSSYTLEVLGRDGGQLQIRSTDINYSVRANAASLEQLFTEQHEHLTFPLTTHELTVGYDLDFDRTALKSQVKNSELVKGSTAYEIVSPASAKVVYSNEANTVVIQDEVYGNTVRKKQLYAAVEEAVENSLEQIDISDEAAYPDMYKQPKIKNGDSKLEQELTAYRNFITRYIRWDLQQGDYETMTPKDIFDLCSYSDGKVSYDDQALRDWIEAFCLKYKTTDKDRTIKNHLGQKVTVPAGDYGWQLDYDATVEQARGALAQTVTPEAITAYADDPSEENQKAITIALDGEYGTVAFRKDYKNYQDWDPNNYIEVSLSEQMIYVHQDGEIVFSCPTISGKPVSGRQTRKGVYFIKEHQPSRVLVGENYRTPVSYWVRITWTGTGFHAAPWQSWGAWSPTYYQRRGSHGCLNLQTANAVRIYELTKYREAVFIY